MRTFRNSITSSSSSLSSQNPLSHLWDHQVTNYLHVHYNYSSSWLVRSTFNDLTSKTSGFLERSTTQTDWIMEWEKMERWRKKKKVWLVFELFFAVFLVFAFYLARFIVNRWNRKRLFEQMFNPFRINQLQKG